MSATPTHAMDQPESGPATTQPLLSQRPSIEGGQPILESGTWIRLAPPEAQRDDWLARRLGWSRQMRLWVNLILLSLVLSAVYVGVLVGFEKWTLVQSVFYAASIGYSVGMVPENAAGEDLNLEDDVAIICTCVYAFASMGCLACVGALLVQHVLTRDEKFVRREFERITKESLMATADCA